MRDGPLVPLWPVLEHYGWDPPGDKGYWQSIRCHIHGESRPSCRASSDAGYVVCMACGYKGDGIDLIKHYEGLDFVEALKFAEGIPGIGHVDLQRGAAGESGRGVSGRSRDRRNSGRYVPPRLRGRAGSG